MPPGPTRGHPRCTSRSAGAAVLLGPALFCGALQLAACGTPGAAKPAAPVGASATASPQAATAEVPASPRAASAGPEEVGSGEAPPPPPQLELLAPGAPPRRSLRVPYVKGQVETATWELVVRVALTAKDVAPPEVRPPVVKLGVRSKVLELRPGGRAAVETIFEDVEVLPAPGSSAEVTAAVKSDLQGLVTVSVLSVLAPSGRVEQLTFTVAPDAPPQLRTTLETLRQALHALPPLPDEPLGKGGRWRVDSFPRTTMLALSQSAEYRVLELGDVSARIVGTAKQQAAPQPIALGNLPPGAKVALTTYTGTATVKAERTTTTLFGSLELKVGTKLSARVEGGGEPAWDLRMETAQEARFAPRR